MDPIKPSETFLKIYPPVDRVTIEPLIAFFNERLQGGESTFSYTMLRSYFPAVTEYLLAYTLQLFREQFWMVEELENAGQRYVVFSLPSKHVA